MFPQVVDKPYYIPNLDLVSEIGLIYSNFMSCFLCINLFLVTVEKKVHILDKIFMDFFFVSEAHIFLVETLLCSCKPRGKDNVYDTCWIRLLPT